MNENIAALAGISRVNSVNSCRAVFKGDTGLNPPRNVGKFFLALNLQRLNYNFASVAPYVLHACWGSTFITVIIAFCAIL